MESMYVLMDLFLNATIFETINEYLYSYRRHNPSNCLKMTVKTLKKLQQIYFFIVLFVILH